MSVKVCHITSVHQRYDTRIFLKECTSLAEAGYDVTLLVADEKPEEKLNNVNIIPVPNIPKSRISRILKSGRMMLRSALDIDAEIYHLHDPELLPLAQKLKKSGKKVIFDSHENYSEQIKEKKYIPLLARNIISFIYKRYETKVTKSIDAVIIPTTINNGIDFFKNRSKRTEIISNAALKSEFYDKYEEEFEEREPNTVCYTGGLTYNRGITHLIKAAYKAKVRLILAGTFSPSNYKEELKLLPEYECVTYLGHLGRDELVDIYKKSSIGIATVLNIGQYNTGDNFATKVYEYMSMALPVIITKAPYTEKAVEKYRFGIAVDPVNVKELAEAIRYILDNPESAREMGKNGRTAINEEFNWKIEERKLLNLYKDLLISYNLQKQVTKVI